MTNRDGDDARIRAAFAQLKNDDARERPMFAAVRARAEPKRFAWHRSPAMRLVATALVVAALIATYRVGFIREPMLAVPGDVVALGAWRPATDVLLASPTMLLRLQATVAQSMIELDTLTKGVFP